MTVPLAVAGGPLRAPGLLAEAVELIRAAAALMDYESECSDAAGIRGALQSPSQALHLAVQGAESVDVAALGVPLEQSRLAVIQLTCMRAGDIVRRIVGRSRKAVLATSATEALVLMPGVPRVSGHDRALRDLTILLNSLRHHLPGGWSSGVSAVMHDCSDVPQAYRDACDAAALAAREGVTNLVVDDAWARLTVMRLREALRGLRTAASPLEVLTEYDATHETRFAETIGRWLAANCDTLVTARTMCIHPNTLRYRLSRAERITGLDLQDPDQRLIVQLSYFAPTTSSA